MCKGLVFNIQRFSLHDGPGIRTTVFLKGCPLSCKWCANPESQKSEAELGFDKTKCLQCGACVSTCPTGSISLGENGLEIDRITCTQCFRCIEVCPVHALYKEGTEYTVQELVQEVLKDKPFYDKSGGGVTLSGGEPLMHKNFVLPLLEELKKEGIHVTVETTGLSPFFAEALPYIDLLYYDLKHPDDTLHCRGTGVGNKKIIDHMAYAVANKKDIVARIPVIPGYNDSREQWEEFVHVLHKTGVKQVHLLPFHQLALGKYEQMGLTYDYSKQPATDKKELQEMQNYFLQHGLETQIGG